ncbi:MAG: hypothetical protein IKJ45_02640 [Kiritimatiellae bacterium]|nr:hypothetical protein [Kiritimatiellia bacterium]
MKLCLFPQWDDLVSFMRNLARHSAADICQRNFVRIKPVDGHALLTDRAMNALALTGEAVTLQMPDMIPGKARDFLVRVTAETESDLLFTGAEAFEGDNQDVLMPPNAGETVIYFFTETAPDVFLVARRPVERIET